MTNPNNVFNILIYDHDVAAARSYQEILILSGNRVVVCSCYDTFSDHLESGLFDMAIFDLNDDVGEGSIHAIRVYNYLAALKKKAINTHFLLYTLSSAEEYAEEIKANNLKVLSKEVRGVPFLRRVVYLFQLPEEQLSFWLEEYNRNSKNLGNNVISVSRFLKKN